MHPGAQKYLNEKGVKKGLVSPSDNVTIEPGQVSCSGVFIFGLQVAEERRVA